MIMCEPARLNELVFRHFPTATLPHLDRGVTVGDVEMPSAVHARSPLSRNLPAAHGATARQIREGAAFHYVQLTVSPVGAGEDWTLITGAQGLLKGVTSKSLRGGLADPLL